ncbi:MAG: hypothetical protein K6G01_01865 [Eubacterium sp.]|nr:hypothetical protein [Eubacterium sp.]
MEISEKQLRSLIERVMELTVDLMNPQEEKVVVVYSGSDKKRCVKTLRALRAERACEITLVAVEQQLDCEEFVKEVCNLCKRIVSPQKLFREPFLYDKIVFPLFPRPVLAKCALGISDIPETKIITRAMEEGIDVVVARGALEPFTGKEPEAYQRTIMGYIRTILEYGIEIELDTEGR